ncbi:MAG: DegV family protein [Anaerolineae bacterium]|nr:DegV family protein [Anaerolineae bacterium]
MPGPIRIVTDSSAQFVDPSVVQRYNIIVMPLEIHLDGRVYHEGVDIGPEQFMQRLESASGMPALFPPPVQQFASVYAHLSRETDQVLSLHLSRAMHSTWQQARLATESVLGRVRVEVLDSQSTSIGLGMLVETAAQLAEKSNSLDDVVRTVRKLIPHIYSIFNVESLDYLRRDSLLSESQVALGGILGIKPFLTIEEGELLAMEKVRTRVQAVEKLAEFATEFAALERLVILHGGAQMAEMTRLLVERLAIDFPNVAFPAMMYKPSLACYLGPDATGIMIFEQELDGDEDDDYHYRDYDKDDE